MDKAEWYKTVQRFIEVKGIEEINRNLESEFDARTTHVPEIDGWMTVVNMYGGECMFTNREFAIPEWKLMYPEGFRGRDTRRAAKEKSRNYWKAIIAIEILHIILICIVAFQESR